MTHRIWRQYKALEEKFLVKDPIFPKFKRQFDLENIVDMEPQPVKIEIPQCTLINESEKAAENLLQVFLHDSQINIINLRKDADKVPIGKDKKIYFQ